MLACSGGEDASDGIRPSKKRSTTRSDSVDDPVAMATEEIETGSLLAEGLGLFDSAIGWSRSAAKDLVAKVSLAVADISPEEEWRWGQELHQAVREEFQLVPDHPRLPQLRRLLGQFEGEVTRTEGQGFSIYVIDDPTINAFAMPGGHLYFHAGLLALMPEDHQVGWVIGHEVAHVELRHCVQQVSLVKHAHEVAGLPAAELTSVVLGVLALGYSQENELDCDRWSYERMRERKLTKDQCLRGVKTMLEHLGEDGHGHPTGEVESRRVERILEALSEYLGTHPPFSKRLAALEELQ